MPLVAVNPRLDRTVADLHGPGQHVNLAFRHVYLQGSESRAALPGDSIA